MLDALFIEATVEVISLYLLKKTHPKPDVECNFGKLIRSDCWLSVSLKSALSI